MAGGKTARALIRSLLLLALAAGGAVPTSAAKPQPIGVGETLRAQLPEGDPETTALSDFFRLIFRTDDPRRAFFRSLADQMRTEPLR